jgi:hypothetical protein
MGEKNRSTVGLKCWFVERTRFGIKQSTQGGCRLPRTLRFANKTVFCTFAAPARTLCTTTLINYYYCYYYHYRPCNKDPETGTVLFCYIQPLSIPVCCASVQQELADATDVFPCDCGPSKPLRRAFFLICYLSPLFSFISTLFRPLVQWGKITTAQPVPCCASSSEYDECPPPSGQSGPSG